MHLLSGAILGLACLSLAAADVRDVVNQQSFSSTSNLVQPSPNSSPFVAASFSSNNNGELSGGTFVANNGQIVKQSFNPNGGASYSSKTYNSGNNPTNNYNNKRYWWMDTGASPFRKQYNVPGNTRNSNNNYNKGCQSFGCSLGASYNNIHTQNTHHTQHVKRQDNFAQNPFLNSGGNFLSQPSNNVYTQTAISGSASDVNNLLTSSQSNLVSNSFTSNSLTSGRLTQPLQHSGANNQYLPPKQITRTPCTGSNQICAPKQLCPGGKIQESQIGLILNPSQACDSTVEACCTIQPEAKPQQQSTPCNQPNSACTSPNYCSNGYIDQNVEQNIRARPSSDRCYAPEVCCKFAPTQDNTIGAESTILTNEGYVVKVPSNQYLPSFPEPQPQPNNPIPFPVSPTTFRPAPTTQRPIPTTQRYVPPQTTQRPIPTTQRPIPTTQRPIPTTQRYVPPQTTRYTPPRTTPFKAQQYIPPRDNEIGQPSDDNLNILKPMREESILNEPIRPTRPPPIQQTLRPRPTQPRPQGPEAPIQIPVGCPAAMNCTAIEFCTATAVISKTPIVLSEQQALFRVPMTDCQEPKTGLVGKCCRDPDYVDPWPVGQLGQYNPELFNTGQYKPEKVQSPRQPARGESLLSQNRITATTNVVNSRVSPPARAQITNQPNPFQSTNPPRRVPGQVDQIPSPTASCGTRNVGTQPRGAGPLDTGFGEFPWQAMVILESNKSLLCGGAIVEDNIVATSASCVYGLRPNDIMIKGGEWRLGSDEEPKAFQIVRVKNVVFHPAYQPTTINHDVALLHLEDKLRYDTHIGPICLDDQDLDSSSTNDCVVTGWGKKTLQVHIQNALMHSVSVSVLPPNECQSTLASSRLTFSDSTICGIPRADSCEADVGSALACPDKTGRYVMKGVYSAETGCGTQDQVTAFTKIDAQWVRDSKRNPNAQNRVNVPQPEYLPQSNSPQGYAVAQQKPPVRGQQYLPPY